MIFRQSRPTQSTLLFPMTAWSLVPAILVTLLPAAGCGPTQPGTVRVIDAPPQRVDASFFPGLQMTSDGILVAVVRTEERAWFYKVTGRNDDIERVADDVEAFVKGTSLDASGIPEWSLPPGWTEMPGDRSRMRFATIRLSASEPPLDLVVTPMPLQEDWLHFQLHNLNRWRLQLQLPPEGPAALANASRSETAGGDELVVFRLQGRLAKQQPPRTAPPPVTSPPPPETGSADETLTYTTPSGWKPGRASPSRKASFVVTGDSQSAEIAVSAWPAGAPAMADPLANVNRWRGQVGLPAIDAAQLPATLEAVQVDGLDASFVALDATEEATGDAAADRSPSAIRAVLLKRGDQMWFFKLSGDQALVQRETANFRTFVDSVRFPSQ